MKKVTKRVLGFILAMAMVIGQLANAGTSVAAEETGSGYALTVSSSTTEVKAGDTVTLTAKLTKDGVEVTDLSAAGVQLWWWTDKWTDTTAMGDAEYSNYDNNSGYSLTADVKLPSEGLYYIVAEVQDSAGTVAKVTTSFDTTAVVETETPSETETETPTETTESTESTESTEEAAPVYAVVATPETAEVVAGETVSLSAKVTVDGEEVTDLEAAGLKLWWWADSWNDHSDGNSDAKFSNYDSNSGYSLTADVTVPSAGTYYIVADVEDANGKVATSLVTITVTGESDADVYEVVITADETSVKAGETVSLTAKVTKNGEEITDLEAEGYYLWWWTDTWNDHTDGKDDAVYSNYDANSGYSLTADVTLPSIGNYYIVAELQDADYATLVKSDIALKSTDPNVFTATDGNYTVEVTVDDVTPETGDTVQMSAKVTKADGTVIADLSANGLSIWWWTDTWADGHSAGLSDAVYSNYDSNSGNSFTADVTLPSTGTYYITAQLQGSDVDLKNYVELTTTEADVDTTVEGEITVEKVKDLSDDFAMGMDISSIISEFESGVVYKDFEGNIIDNVTDFCKFIAENGVTHVRVRVWVNPYDADGNGYGGGNCDTTKAVQIAEGCRAAGLKMLVDFHCSDFWADPGKQQVPKKWTEYGYDQLVDTVYAYIDAALKRIDPSHDVIDMVQVGNETTGAFVGESSVANMCEMFNAGAAAVRAYNEDVKVVIHVTNPEKGNVTKWAKNLDTYDVDYDILATSYYPYWHGTLANLTSELQTVRETYNKDVMVAETSYAYTLADSDGHSNTVRVGNNDTATSYPFSVQGQATSVRDVIAAVNDAGGIGVFYWEAAWITVGDITGLEGDALEAQIAANQEKWEKYGSGWASSYAAEYDPTDAGKWYGGSAVDNEAMFYPDGTPTAAIYVWNYVKTGAVSKYTSVEEIEAPAETIDANGTFTLPETVVVTYNSGDVAETVVWNADDVAAIDTAVSGTYKVNGTVTFSKAIDDGAYAGQTTAAVVYTLTVKEPNLITDAAAAGFEDGTDFVVEGSGVDAVPAKDDPYEGNGSMHWYSKTATTGTVTYNKVITLEAGKYTLEMKAQGYAGDTVTLQLLDTEGNVIVAGTPKAMEGWAVWQTPSVSFETTGTLEVLIRVVVDMQDGGWGTADALYLYRTGDAEVSGGETGSGSTGSTPAVKDNGDSLEEEVSSNGNDYRVITNKQMPGAEIVAEKDIIPTGSNFVIVEEKDGSANYEKAEAAVGKHLKDHKGFVVYEMDLVAANGAKIEQLDGYINVTIPMPAGLELKDGERYVVYRVEDNGKLTRCTTAWADGRITFATNHFSTYVLTVESVNGISPKTDDGMLPSAYFAMMLLAMGMVVTGLYAKKRTR